MNTRATGAAAILFIILLVGRGGPVSLDPAADLEGGEVHWAKPQMYRFNLQRNSEGVTFRVVLEFDPDTESDSAVCPELPGFASAGATEGKARANMEEASKLWRRETLQGHYWVSAAHRDLRQIK